ncbi:hypothetical protein CH282_15250 [Rhodococcus sp. 06-418-1B]|nr:hypothetical protein CH282_15250 [Rhodococcus sp. 06-418-1B]
MSATLAIDPNVRVEANETYAGFEDLLDGSMADLSPGAHVVVREPESNLVGDGTVSSVDYLRQLIYISIDWKTLRLDSSRTLCGVSYG